MTEAAMLYDFEQRADSNIEEDDLKRLEKEINHNLKKQGKAKRMKERGLRPDGQPLVRRADHQVAEQLVGGANAAVGAEGLIMDADFNEAAGRNRNEEGMIVPANMRNYVDHDIMWGLFRLRKYDKIDLFWGLIQGMERDLLYMHILVVSLAAMILGYCIATMGKQKSYNGNF
jgi:hypothetical protein